MNKIPTILLTVSLTILVPFAGVGVLEVFWNHANAGGILRPWIVTDESAETLRDLAFLKKAAEMDERSSIRVPLASEEEMAPKKLKKRG